MAMSQTLGQGATSKPLQSSKLGGDAPSTSDLVGRPSATSWLLASHDEERSTARFPSTVSQSCVQHGEFEEGTTPEGNKKKRRASAEPDDTYRQSKKTTKVPQELENRLDIQGVNSFSVTQHNFRRAQAVNMANPVFNSIGHDQINHNYHDSNLLWDAIKDVGAFHNSEVQVQRDRCLLGTRRAVLRILNDWKVSEIQATPVCWLSGAAGVGKSAIALTVAEEWEKDGLVASFFFRSDPQRNNASSLILSIAYGLTVSRPHLKALITQRIASDPSILKARLEYQYAELVLKHLSLASAQTNSCNLVIIDGLDDCSDSATQCLPYMQPSRIMDTKYLQVSQILPTYQTSQTGSFI
ncbi:hypothetical protein L218DRAFT_1077516 [Marasmius fiardii PR-910]|nr:hypothetical protein L218DRAFT_1077516 [Marasmius fiardii PR-910]